MADDRGKKSGRQAKPVRPTIPGTLPRSTGSTQSTPARPQKSKDSAQSRRSTSSKPAKKTASAKRPTRGTTKPRSGQGKSATKARTASPRPSRTRPVNNGPSDTTKRIIRILLFLLVLAGIIAAGLFIKDKLNEHAQTLRDSSTDADTEIVACTPDQVEMTTSWSDIVAGQPVTFTIDVTNTSDKPCSIDAGPSSLVLNVVSGNDSIWNSSYCQANTDSRLYVLGEGKSSQLSVAWDGLRNTSDCQTGLAAPRAGVYVVTGTIGGVDFPDIRSVTELVNADGSGSAETDATEEPVETGDEEAPAEESPAEEPAPEETGN